MGAGPNAVGTGRRTWSTASAGRRSVAGQARSRPQGERIRCTRFSAVNDGELLPLACDEATLVVFNVTTVLDALDLDPSVYEQSTPSRFRSCCADPRSLRMRLSWRWGELVSGGGGFRSVWGGARATPDRPCLIGPAPSGNFEQSREPFLIVAKVQRGRGTSLLSTENKVTH